MNLNHMNLKTLKEHYELIKIENEHYALYDKYLRVYADYSGVLKYPYVGTVRMAGGRFSYIPTGFSPYECEKLFDNIDELNLLISDFIVQCKNWGVTTDCCNPSNNNGYKCEIAIHQFIRNNTCLEYKDSYMSVIEAGSIRYHLYHSFDKFSIKVELDKGETYFIHDFTEPFTALTWMKGYLTFNLLMDITEPLKSIQKIHKSESEIIDYNNLFDKDMIYKCDLKNFKIEQVGSLKKHLVGKLEDILSQLEQ